MVKVKFDPFGATFLADPYPAYRRLQEEDPVHWSDPMGGWVLTAYAPSALSSRQVAAGPA